MANEIKILLLSDANSAHTQKWCKHLALKGIKIALWSMSSPTKASDGFYHAFNIPVYFPKKFIQSKIFYPTYIFSLLKSTKLFQPHIIHAHYASSYGLLGALTRFHPYIISVWGSDVYKFPKLNFLFKKILEYNLSKADAISSTSQSMAQETNKYTSKHIHIIPFGIDTNVFFSNRKRSLFSNNDIVIGTIKSLSKTYGIDTLIKSFALLKNEYPHLPLKLLIVGDGPLKEQYIELSKKLNIFQYTQFIAHVPNNQVPQYLNELDIYVSLSRHESFGVSAIEAMACELPVVLSDIPAFREITHNQLNDLIVPKNNPSATALVLKKLLFNQALRENYGKIGHNIITEHYNIYQNTEQLIQLYQKLFNTSHKQ